VIHKDICVLSAVFNPHETDALSILCYAKRISCSTSGNASIARIRRVTHIDAIALHFFESPSK
jgi:hypothetical protein